MSSFALHQRSIYRGPNLYTPAQAIRWTLSRKDGEDWPGAEALATILPPLIERLPALADRLELQPDSSVAAEKAPHLAELLMHLAMVLQAEAWHPAEAGCVVPGPVGKTYDIVCEYMDPAICQQAMAAASSLVLALTQPSKAPAGKISQILQRLMDRAERLGLDQTTRALVAAAEVRGIPWFRLHPRARIVQLGHGRHAERIFESLVGSEGQIAGRYITPHKHLTHHLLWHSGLPVPRQGTAATPQQAVDVAARVGYPVVLKPGNAGKGHKVVIGLRNAEEVKQAFEKNFHAGQSVIVEGFLPGDDHRMLVVGDRLLAVAKRVPASVVGDGRSSVRALIDAVNRDPRRGLRFTKKLVRIELDALALTALKEQGLGPESVPPPGQRVFLRKTANISTGGTAVDVTDRVHPDNRRMAEMVAGVIGTKVAGIDFITPDIGRSYHEVGGICEVNSTPGLRPHWVAEGGEDRDVVNPILDLCFPPGGDHHVPTAVITGTNGKTTTSYMLSHILRAAGRSVGLVTTIGVSVNSHMLARGDLAGPKGIDMVARQPKVDAIVAEAARGALINRGLGLNRCDVGAVLNITTDHLGERGVESLEDMARVKAIVAKAATGTLVLNADDPLCRAMAEDARAGRVCLVSVAEESAPLAAHLAAGGPGARFRERGGTTVLTFCREGREIDILPGKEIPATLGGHARHNMHNALFAAALADGLGIGVDVIREALASFRSDYDTVPGRVNLFDGHPFKVILDYGHNPDGYRMIGPMVTAMAAGKGRRICVFTSPADRNDAHLAEIAEAAVPHFDFFICRQGAQKDGQKADVSEKLRAALIARGVSRDCILAGQPPEEAVRSGLEMAQPNDVVYIMSSQDPDGRFWQLIKDFGKDRVAERTQG